MKQELLKLIKQRDSTRNSQKQKEQNETNEQRNKLKSGKFVVAFVSSVLHANRSNFIRLFITEIPGETTVKTDLSSLEYRLN